MKSWQNCRNLKTSKIHNRLTDYLMIFSVNSPSERLSWLCHSPFRSPPLCWNKGCLWRERVRKQCVSHYLSSIWKHQERCVEAAVISNMKWPQWNQHVQHTKPFVKGEHNVVDLTSSARKRSLVRKFWASLILSLTVLFFTCDLMALACWPMLSWTQKTAQHLARQVQILTINK